MVTKIPTANLKGDKGEPGGSDEGTASWLKYGVKSRAAVETLIEAGVPPLVAEAILEADIDGKVADAIAADPTVAAAAAAAVTADIAGRDLVDGDDNRLLVRTDLPGWAFAVQDERGYVAFGVAADGSTFGRLRGDTLLTKKHPTGNILVPDSMHEWWITPIAHTMANGTRIGGGISSTGEIVVWEFTKRGEFNFQILGTAPNDDHCAPAYWYEAGRRRLVIWQGHGADEFLRVSVSSIDGKTWAPAEAVSIGLSCSYAQIHKVAHLSDADQDTFEVITRRGSTAWGAKRISINHATGAITVGRYQGITSSTGVQSYNITRSVVIGGQQCIDGFWYPNPMQPTHEVHAWRWNLVTGVITSPADEAVAANIDGTNLPLIKTAITPLFADVAAGLSRRIYYPKPGTEWTLLMSEWAILDPTGGTNYEKTWAAGVVSSSVVSVAGQKMGDGDDGNYLGAMSYSPSGTRIASAVNVNGKGYLYVKDGPAVKLVERLDYKIGRPYWVSETEIVWFAIEVYGETYLERLAHQRSTKV